MTGSREAPLELLALAERGAGLTLITGLNGAGKSSVARALEARVAGARLLSAESQQAFFEAQLAADESDFEQGADASTLREVIVIDRGRLAFRGTPAAYLERVENEPRTHLAPPVELGSWYEPLDPSIGVYQRVEPSHRQRAQAWLAWLQLGLEPAASFRELSFGEQRRRS